MTFGEKLQKLRKERGMSQEELAEKLMVTRQTISKWELNQSTPELEFIARLSDILEVTTDYLIKEQVEVADGKADAQSENGAEAVHTVSEMPGKQKGISNKFAARLTFGVILTAIGVIGVIVFIVMSVTDPWVSMNEWGTFHGLLGFLFGTDTLWLFIIFILFGLTGIGYCGWLAFHEQK